MAEFKAFKNRCIEAGWGPYFRLINNQDKFSHIKNYVSSFPVKDAEMLAVVCLTAASILEVELYYTKSEDAAMEIVWDLDTCFLVCLPHFNMITCPFVTGGDEVCGLPLPESVKEAERNMIRAMKMYDKLYKGF